MDASCVWTGLGSFDDAAVTNRPNTPSLNVGGGGAGASSASSSTGPKRRQLDTTRQGVRVWLVKVPVRDVVLISGCVG